MINQNLKVVPQGLIESGNVQVQADGSGLVSFQETIIAGIGPFNETDQHSSEIKVDPSLLLSINIKAGMRWTIGGAVIEIIDIIGRTADVNLSIKADQISLAGTAAVDLSHQFISINHVLLSGNVHGEDVVIELVPS